MLPRWNCWEWNFSGRTTLSVASHSLFQKKTPGFGLPIFSRKKQPHWLCWWVFSMRCQLLNYQGKSLKNSFQTILWYSTLLWLRINMNHQAPWLSCILVFGSRMGTLGCWRKNYDEMELIIAVYSSPRLPNVSSQKTVGLIREGIISHN